MVNRILQEHSRERGSRTALVFGNERYSYAQVEEQAARCAASLKREGAEPGKGVALILKNSPELVLSYLAASRLGVPAFLLDPGFKTRELLRVFTGNEIAVALCESDLVGSLEQLREHTGQDFSIYSRGANFGVLLE